MARRGLVFATALVLSLGWSMPACATDAQIVSDAGHLSIVGTPGEAEYEQLATWMQSNEDLMAMRKRTTYHVVPTGSAIYRERVAPYLKGTPAVRLQRADGTVLYESVGENLPSTAFGLAMELQLAEAADYVRQCCPRRRQPQPEPQLPTKVDVVVRPSPVVQPASPPQGRNDTSVLHILGLVAAGVLGFAVGVAWEWKYPRKRKRR